MKCNRFVSSTRKCHGDKCKKRKIEIGKMILNTTIGDTHGVRAILNSRTKGRWIVYLTHKMFAGCVSAGAEMRCSLTERKRAASARLGGVRRRRPRAGCPCCGSCTIRWPGLDWDSCGGETVPVTPV
jgi:hypothetical protein